jgi:hypothetical protein
MLLMLLLLLWDGLLVVECSAWFFSDRTAWFSVELSDRCCWIGACWPDDGLLLVG